MRIGIVTTWLERGGTYVSKQLRAALETRHEVFIYARGTTYKPRGREADPSVYWGKIPSIPETRTAMLIGDFLHWVESRKIDVVLFNEQSWWMPIAACIDKGIRIGTYVDYYTHETVPFFKGFDFLICNTARHYSVFSDHPQSFYIPWGTDVDLFHPQAKPEERPEVTFFHSCGTSPFRKGTDYLIEAFGRMKEKAHLIIHTQKDLVREIPQAGELIERLKSEGRLSIELRTVTAPGLYHTGDVYVYPSRLDGIGLTMAEALACGLPVITCDNAPMNEFIDGENGTLVPVREYQERKDGYYWPMGFVDIDKLAEAMDSYARRKDDIPRLKEVARRSAEEKFNWQRNSQDLARMIEEIEPIDPESKAEAARQIRAFEKQRGSWRLRSYYALPWVYWLVGTPIRKFKRRYRRRI